MKKRRSFSLFFSFLLFSVVILTGFTNPVNVEGLDDSVPAIGADRCWENLDITGGGVKVGIIDTGIDWKIPDFYKPDGGTYDLKTYTIGSEQYYYVDMNENGIKDFGESLLWVAFDASSGYLPDKDWLVRDENEDSDWALGEEDSFLWDGSSSVVTRLGTCKVWKIWDQSTGSYWHRGVNLTYDDPFGNSTETDYDGHGTHVASIVCGGQISPVRREYVGVAPDAEIIFVKVGRPGSYTWDDAIKDVIDGIKYCVNAGADVISISLGFETWQFWDGSDDVDRAVEWAYSRGVPCVVAASNQADNEQHWYYPSVTNNSRIGFMVEGDTIYDEVLFTILWRNKATSMNFTLHNPSGGSVAISLPSSPQNTTWQTGLLVGGGWTAYTMEYRQKVSPRDTVRVDVNITRDGSDIETGNWYFNVSEISDEESVHAVAYDYRSYNVTMLDHVTPHYTLTSPATADHAITVASYNTYLPEGYPGDVGDISFFSSVGPRIDGGKTVTITAPGMFVFASVSNDADYGQGSGLIGWVGYAGTSQATPHVAGTIALMLEGNNTLKGRPADVYKILINNTIVDEYVENEGSVPNDYWGYGKLDAYNSVRRSMGMERVEWWTGDGDDEVSFEDILSVLIVMALFIGFVWMIARRRRRRGKEYYYSRPSVAYCWNCGASLSPDQKYCTHCGNKLR